MQTLERLRDPAGVELARMDLAEVDLACAAGLPGSEALDVPACLAWIGRAAAWAHQHTRATLDEFARDPAAYDGSEGTFRMVALMSVLQRGLGVRYNRERVEDPGDFADSRDAFIHGIVEGRGGTCASLPVLYAAVGRRLGYPLRLVRTARHQFVRWDDPDGERFNVEINDTGLNRHPDGFYLTWPVPIAGTEWERVGNFLRSLTPREEVAQAWLKRGYCLQANGRLREAVDSIATACSVEADDRLLDLCLVGMLARWREAIAERAEVPLATAGPRISDRRRYPGLPIELEQEIADLEAAEGRSGRPPGRPTGVRVAS